MISEVIKSPTHRADVVASLRSLADSIEHGRYGDVRLAAAVIVVGDMLTTFGWGRCNDLELSGALARGAVIAGSALTEIEETGDHDGRFDTQVPAEVDDAS